MLWESVLFCTSANLSLLKISHKVLEDKVDFFFLLNLYESCGFGGCQQLLGVTEKLYNET